MNQLKLWYRLLWVGYGGTLLSFVAWATLLPNINADGGFTIPWYAALVLPLLLPLPGVIKGSDYTIAGSSMLCIFYLAFAMMEAIAGSSIGLITALLSALWFVASMFFVRFTAQRREAEQAATKTAE